MKKVKLKYKKGYIDNIEENTPLYEVAKKVKGDFRYTIVGAKLGEYYVDLGTVVTENNSVEFFDTSSSIGNRIYSRSLEFLLMVAAKKIIGEESDILIHYSLENGVYCEITGKKITNITIKKIEAEMKKMVEDKLLFNHIVVDRIESIKFFKKQKQFDKVNSLKYITNKTISLYCLEDVYDYFYGPLVPNTGYLTKFDITYLKDNSFILSFPTASNPNKLLKYKEHKLTSKTYKDFQDWGKEVGITTAPDLNKIIASGHEAAAVKLFETHYDKELAQVVSQICNKKDKIKLVLLAGPSSSGKTTTAVKMMLYLRVKGIVAKKISLDDYFVDRIYCPKDEHGNYDFSDIKALDIKLFQKQLVRILKGDKVLMPTYDFVSGKKVYRDNYMKLEKNEIVIVEGIHTLNEKITSVVPRNEKFKIFMSPLMNLKLDNHNRVHTTDVRKLRRIVRDNFYRGTDAETTLAMWPNVDKEAIKNIYPYQDDADAMINSSLCHELNVLRIYAEPLLFGIESDSKEYAEAQRLISLLRNFLTISSETVGNDSILREFIGGSIFTKGER